MKTRRTRIRERLDAQLSNRLLEGPAILVQHFGEDVRLRPAEPVRVPMAPEELPQAALVA